MRAELVTVAMIDGQNNVKLWRKKSLLGTKIIGLLSQVFHMIDDELKQPIEFEHQATCKHLMRKHFFEFWSDVCEKKICWQFLLTAQWCSTERPWVFAWLIWTYSIAYFGCQQLKSYHNIFRKTWKCKTRTKCSMPYSTYASISRHHKIQCDLLPCIGSRIFYFKNGIHSTIFLFRFSLEIW